MESNHGHYSNKYDIDTECLSFMAEQSRMDNKTISNWIRQTRYRAKKYNILSDLDIKDISEILSEHNGNCAYCQKNAPETFDQPFPLKDGAPNVSSNVLPICRKCKNIKKNNDITWLYSNQKIDNDIYLYILSKLFARKHGNLIREHMKKLSGYSSSDE